MAGPQNRVESAEIEAADWHGRLAVREVSTRTLEDFFEWRARPGNLDAWRRVERAWGEAGALAGDPEVQAALTQALHRRGPARGGRGTLAVGVAALAATLVLAMAGGGWWWVSRNAGVHATGVGEQRLVRLADGSSVRLDTDSRVRVRFSGGRRDVEMIRGQALFVVAPDRARPFVVSAGETAVTAVGTVFDVRRDGAEVRVTLVEGVVEVARRDAPAAPTRMVAGQQARAGAGGVATRVVDAPEATSWAEGQIVFRDRPLGEAVAEVNRYLEHKVVVADPGLAGAPVNGRVRTGDRAAFVSAAAGALDLVAVETADGTVELSRRIKN